MRTTRLLLSRAYVADKFKNLSLRLVVLLPLWGLGSHAWAEGGTISGSGTKDSPYLLEDAADWATFANYDNRETYWASGVYVKMAADVGTAEQPVTTMVGHSYYYYQGVFDGNGHTLTVAITSYYSSTGAAPFLYVQNASISRLTTVGTITAGGAYYQYLSGIVARCKGATIKNCVSAVDLHWPSGASPDTWSAGIVAYTSDGNLVIRNCAFTGSFSVEGTDSPTMTNMAGILSYYYSGEVVISNCLNAGTFPTENLCKIARIGNNGTITNCYSTTDASSNGDGYNDGGTYTEATGAELAALLGSAWTVSNGQAVPDMDESNLTAGPLSGSGTQASPYLLEDAADWAAFTNSEFADLYWASGVYVKMTADIGTTDAPVTTTAGNGYSPFCGNFDGDGHTLTVNYSVNVKYLAPFYKINGATIHDLTVAGTVSTNGWEYNAGLVGWVSSDANTVNTISDCNVTATVGGGNFMGGIVGYVDDYTTLTLNNCVFSGTLSINNYKYAAGMVGSCSSHGYTLNISNCLFKGSYNELGTRTSFSPIAMKGLYGIVTVNASNCYYTEAPTLESSSSYYVAVGTQVYTTVPEGTVYRTVTAADGADYYGPIAVSGVADTYSYTGSPIAFSYTVTDPDGTTVMTEGNGYTAVTALYGSPVETIADKGTYTLTLTGKGDYSGTATISFIVRRDMLNGSGTEADPYLIEDAADWATFCAESNYDKLWASGKYVKMTADVGTAVYPVTTMAGTNYHYYYGNFDGDGHTLTVCYGSAESPLSANYVAPFAYIQDASIKYLHIAGHLYTSGYYAGGMAGYAYATNTFRNCRSSVAIMSSYSGNCQSAGFVGHRNGGGMLSLIHCLFDGELQGTSSSQWGGLVGYHNTGSQTFTTFTNCLFSPKAVNIGGSNSGTLINIHSSYVGNATFINCYYTTALNTLQGKDASAMDDVLLAATLGGWSTDGGLHPVTGDSNLGTTVATGIKYYYLNDGSVHQPKPTLTDIKGNVLTEGTDYTLAWSGDGTTVGTYTVTANAQGTYTGTAAATYTVTEGVPVTASTTLFEDTYVYNVYDDVTINDRITVLGEVIIVLGEGTTLTAKKGITVGEGTKLTIQGSGTLTATGVNEYSGIGSDYSYWDMPSTGTIIINSGTINATGGSGDAAGIGGSRYSAAGTITINGGIVTATGGGVGCAIGGGGSPYDSSTPGAGGIITINGGQVTATSANGYGIGKGKNAKGEEYDGADGTITLSWTNVDNDFIQASSFAGTVVLEKNFFYEGGETGVTLDNLAAHAGEKIIPSTVSTDKNLAYATISGVSTSYLYTGNVIAITPTVTDFLGRALTLGTDYDLAISPATVQEQGDYTLTISPSTGSTYTESLTIGFTVTDFLEADGTDYFVNMPTTGAKQASLVAHNLAKVYDDGGKSSNFSRNCDGTLMLLAPAGYSIRLSGTIDLAYESQVLTIYDGETTEADVLGTFNTDATVNVFSTSNKMLVKFVTSSSGTASGLDLTANALTQMAVADWNILQQAYTAMGSGEGWTNTWNFNTEGRSEQTLPGVTTYQGHVMSIDLSGNNLSGAFPVALLTLPQLQSLDLSGNQLTGDVGELNGFPTEASLTSLNISDNQLSGNIGVFAANLPNLTTLNASNNCLTDVDPMISPNVTTLNLSQQTMASVVNVDLASAASDGFPDGFPSILLYNHGQQKYATSLNATGTAADGWKVSVYFRDSGVTLSGINYTGENDANIYYGASGDQLQLSAENAYCSLPGVWYQTSTFGMKLSFAPGDVNFNGKVDVTDLQGQINFAFEEYGFLGYHLFNFTAADLWVDNSINVLDVVEMVDILLQTSPNQARWQSEELTERLEAFPTTEQQTERLEAFPTTEQQTEGLEAFPTTEQQTERLEAFPTMANVSIRDNRIVVNTETPITAFELTLVGNASQRSKAGLVGNTSERSEVSDALRLLGFTFKTNRVGSTTRIVGYSMNGAAIPVGETEICTLPSDNTRITQVVLSDANADAIPASIEGVASGISDALRLNDNGQMTNDNCYDLSGRKIVNRKSVNRKSATGVYILNGTKIMNK